MNNFLPKPYKLFNKIQNYEWGTKNENAFIPNIIGIKAQRDLPYAELWIGAHPKASSEIEFDGEKIQLKDFIARFTKECLGEFVSEKFNGQFPFLLKILSADKALSIQTHPNKKDAEKLHKKDPKNYPDDNHKPEIAIAVDSLIAIAGFRPINEIERNIKSLPELNLLIDEIFINDLQNSETEEMKKESIKNLYSALMRKAEDKNNLSACVSNICNRLNSKKELTFEENQFLIQHKLYGVDIGLFSFFFFNMVDLQPGQAIFTSAGVPHAYIKGNIIECMANSDNVVRAGLTNKFKDVDTLLGILQYDFKKYVIINSERKTDEFVYKTSAEEFEVSAFDKRTDFKKEIKFNNKPSVYLITEGVLEVEWIYNGEKNIEQFKKGDSFFVPASLSDYSVKSLQSCRYFVASVPS